MIYKAYKTANNTLKDLMNSIKKNIPTYGVINIWNLKDIPICCTRKSCRVSYSVLCKYFFWKCENQKKYNIAFDLQMVIMGSNDKCNITCQTTCD